MVASRLMAITALLLVTGAAHGQPVDPRPDERTWTASEIRAGLLAPADRSVAESKRDVKRSIPLAFGLSALAPGAGQAYNRDWAKAAVTLGLEVAVFTVWSLTRSKGLSAEDDFRAFAHAQWDPGQYATWLNDYVTYLEDQFGHTVSAPPAQVPSGINFMDPPSWTNAERSAVDSFFRQIQTIERQVYHPETGATFSHQLPGFGEQQYYELIGKYFQFAPGWEDYPDWRDGNGGFNVAIDPERTGQGGSKPNVSDTFFQYARDHAHAQDLLRTASRLSTLFVVNHLLAGIDAAVTAKLRNDRIATNMALLYMPEGPPQPSVSLRLSF